MEAVFRPEPIFERPQLGAGQAEASPSRLPERVDDRVPGELPQYPNLLTTGEVLQAQLAKIGIRMKITQLEVTTWLDRYAGADYQATTAYWAGTVDPDNFYSNMILSTAPDNFTKYVNPAVDALIKKANTTTEFAARKKLYQQIRQIVWADVPAYLYRLRNDQLRNDTAGVRLHHRPPAGPRHGPDMDVQGMQHQTSIAVEVVGGP